MALKKLSEAELQDWEQKIDRMGHREMACLYRFAKAGHPCFRRDVPRLYSRFMARFNRFGGITTAISKQIGWDRK